jgi:3-hydroxyisobutyrate dehydrogenase-like beta-hydroxyacid dehydrogenase
VSVLRARVLCLTDGDDPWGSTLPSSESVAVRTVVLPPMPAAPPPGTLVADCDVLVTAFSSADALGAASHGPDGLLRRLPPGLLWIEMTWMSPPDKRAFARQAQSAGAEILDGQLVEWRLAPMRTLLVGGDPLLLERATPVLRTLSNDIIHTGPTGSAAERAPRDQARLAATFVISF